ACRGGRVDGTWHSSTGIARRQCLCICARNTVLRVPLRDMGEIVRVLVNDQRASLRTLQIVLGERVGGCDEFRRTVRTDLQGGQIATCRMLGAPADLEMTSGGVEG